MQQHHVALTKNILRATEAYHNLVEAANANSPGIGLFSGDAGNGKTTAGGYLFVQADGVLVRCLRADTLGTFLERLAGDLGLEQRQRKADMLNYIVKELALTRRPLFIDEADYLVERTDVLETIRDIYDMANVPIVLIGYAQLPRKVKRLPQLFSRIAQHVEFRKADMDDIVTMADSLVDRTKISEDLLAELLDVSRGNFRSIHTGLVAIEKFAAANDLPSISLAQWGDQAFFPTAD